jgi:hypothetical protein
MHLPSIRNSPMRRPQWRFDRVIEMIRHRPRPLPATWEDDHPIRLYRRVLVEFAIAQNDENGRAQILREAPDLWAAHMLGYSANQESRQILEARLLTSESFGEIAQRFGTSAKAIEYFHAIWFDVRNRLSRDVYVHKIIRGEYSPASEVSGNDLTYAQRGYVLRLVAFHGGPHSLDAMIRGMSTANESQSSQVVERFGDDCLQEVVRTFSAIAASTMNIDQRSSMRLMKLAIRNRNHRMRSDAKASRNSDIEKHIDKIIATVAQGRVKHVYSDLSSEANAKS